MPSSCLFNDYTFAVYYGNWVIYNDEQETEVLKKLFATLSNDHFFLAREANDGLKCIHYNECRYQQTDSNTCFIHYVFRRSLGDTNGTVKW